MGKEGNDYTKHTASGETRCYGQLTVTQELHILYKMHYIYKKKKRLHKPVSRDFGQYNDHKRAHNDLQWLHVFLIESEL